MCTFQDDRTVMVCDVAIGRVREEVQTAFGTDRVRCTVVEGQGNLVQAEPGVDVEQFGVRVRAAIDDAQRAGRLDS
jgi:hypothetical protein